MKLSHKIILYILLLIPVCESFAQYSPEEKFNKATDFYSAGKYKEALDEWLSVYSSGIRSSTLQYNIGNAYFKTSNIPGAILFYERALLLKPADEDIQYNLKIARTLIVDKFIEIPDLFFVKWFNFLSLTLSANNWAKISIVTFILSLCALSLYIYTSRYRFKVAGFWLSILFLSLSIATVSFSLRNKKLINDNPDAILGVAFCIKRKNIVAFFDAAQVADPAKSISTSFCKIVTPAFGNAPRKMENTIVFIIAVR